MRRFTFVCGMNMMRGQLTVKGRRRVSGMALLVKSVAFLAGTTAKEVARASEDIDDVVRYKTTERASNRNEDLPSRNEERKWYS